MIATKCNNHGEVLFLCVAVTREIYGHGFVSRVFEKNIQHICGLHFQCAVIAAGVAAEVLLLLCFTIHDQLHLVLIVKQQGEDGGGTGLHMEQFLHRFRRGEAQTGGANLVGEVLGEERLVAGHGQKIKAGFLAVAQDEILADIRAQRF